jgi:sodium/potassium-transporting ATPase subunit beta
LEAWRHFIYDKDTGAFFNRTPKSWLLILLFYIVFYSCLTGFWYGILTVSFQFVPTDRPKYTTFDSLIGNNPGLGIRPLQPDATLGSSMFFLKANASHDEAATTDHQSPSNIDWASRYEEFLEAYNNTTNLRECDDSAAGEMGQPACIFHPEVLQDCREYPYGYQVAGNMTQVEPCVLLKVNKIFGWVPEPFEDADLEASELDEGLVIPEKIKNHIRNNKNNIYINCEGAYPMDREVLADNIAYFPTNQGIPFKYFPYNHVGSKYHSPVVAAKFRNLPKGLQVHVECKTWYRGVQHDRKERRGLIQFEILIE